VAFCRVHPAWKELMQNRARPIYFSRPASTEIPDYFAFLWLLGFLAGRFRLLDGPLLIDHALC
jgi:hypothetical protein